MLAMWRKGHLKKTAHTHPSVDNAGRKGMFQGYVPSTTPGEMSNNHISKTTGSPTPQTNAYTAEENIISRVPYKIPADNTPSTSTRASAAPTLLVNNAGSSQEQAQVIANKGHHK